MLKIFWWKSMGSASLNEAYLAWRSEDRKLRAPSVLAKAAPPFVGDVDTSPVAQFVKDYDREPARVL